MPHENSADDYDSLDQGAFHHRVELSNTRSSKRNKSGDFKTKRRLAYMQDKWREDSSMSETPRSVRIRNALHEASSVAKGAALGGSLGGAGKSRGGDRGQDARSNFF